MLCMNTYNLYVCNARNDVYVYVYVRHSNKHYHVKERSYSTWHDVEYLCCSLL